MQTEKETLYLLAKEKYYSGEPIMTDEEFDILEQELIDENSSIIEKVGTYTDSKFKHISPMKSLAKMQVNEDEPTESHENIINNWGKQYSDIDLFFIAQPKYDGNAINLIYKKGKLKVALTRGDGTYGINITDKIKHIVPNNIPLKEDCEIRGEILIETALFEQKYKEFKNPRNYVAGVLSRKEFDIQTIKDLTFMAFEIRIHNPNYISNIGEYQSLKQLGFNKKHDIKYIHFNLDNWKNIFKEFKKYKETECPFQLDGMVFKYHEGYRQFHVGNSHHPDWAIAIKFKPKESITKVTNIQWNIGSTGELIPIANLEPIDLDGSTVSNVTCHNAGYLIDNKIFPGCSVKIVKSGDIIPKIISVIEESDIKYELPKNFKGNNVFLNGCHLLVENYENMDEILIRKLSAGIYSLGMKRIGYSTVKKLFDAGVKSIIDFFNMTESELINTGLFKEGRALDIIFEEKEKINSIDIGSIILALQFENVGGSTAYQIGKYLSGNNDYDFTGLEKKIILKFLNPNSTENILINNFKNVLSNNKIEIKYYSETVNDNSIKVVLTGSPKDYGWNTKTDFLKNFSNVSESKLKDASYLITDSLSSNSSKMQYAIKHKIKIITYSDFYKIYSNS